MDINKLLRGADCVCGRHHSCDIGYVYIEKGATDRLDEICRIRNILIVADENTYRAAGEKTETALKGRNIKKVIFSGKEILVPDEAAVKEVSEKTEDAEMIVGIGSGVIQDLCKYVSFIKGLPYVIVATAPSMDGYASDGAAMIAGGMKVTYPAALPIAIIGDVDVLKNAPMDMIKAGYGDIIGKFSALNDWKLSSIVNGEYFCEYISDITFGQINATLDLADGILKRDENSIKTMMEALVIIGIMMSFAGNSRPASGSEHHLSHFFEITGIIEKSEYFSHGIDVAYSTVVTAALREKLINTRLCGEPYRPDEEMYRKTMYGIYKSVADGCIALQQKADGYRDRTPIYIEKEKEIKELFSRMPTSEQIREMLGKVELGMDDFYSLYGEEKIKNAIFYAKDLKDRYTVLWMYYDYFGGKENV